MTDAEGAAPVDAGLLAAALRRDSADLELYAGVLSASLADWLPPGAVRVSRRRSAARRLTGRQGPVDGLDVVLGERRLSLRTDRGRTIAEICHEVRGIVLSRRRTDLDEWIATLATALAEAAASNARAREAVERFLS